MRRRVPSAVALLGGVLALYLLAPLIAGVRQAALSHWRALGSPALWHACAVSIASATTSTLILAATGIPLAYHLARSDGRFATAVGFVVQLPLALPPLASGILLLFLVGPNGALGHLIGDAFTDSFAGIVLAESFVAAPFLVIAARTAFAGMDPDLEAVAATLGHRPLGTFLRVSLPSARYGLLAGLLLAWLRAFGEFGATMMVAYHPYSLPVYSYVAFGAQGLPAMLPILLPTLALALAVMVLAGLAGVRARAPARGARSAGPDSRRGAVASAPPPERPEPGSAGDALAIDLARRMGEFHLQIAWSPSSRRLAILGPSGSGKSLSLKMIAGIEAGHPATVRLGAHDLTSLDPADRRIAYVPQGYGLMPHLRVVDQLRFARGVVARDAQYWLADLGLQGLENRFPAELSIGQRQRVALARALSRPAALLLLDEPFSALDAPLRARLRRELRELQARIAATTVLVTHDPAEAALLADEILVLDSGRPLQAGPCTQVFRRPANESVARLLGADNVAAAVAAAPDAIDVGGGTRLRVSGPPLRPGARLGWHFAPPHAHPHAAGAYRAIVESIAEHGLLRELTVRFGDVRVRITDAGSGHAPGDELRFDLDPGAIQVWPADPG
ncbi:MAG: ATP-binding cassette domain-containing protein [Gammaproteobacteria bacterium]|nr:ATP-binding cassette domain-containing protein [Gammaproteobacteria bacterium]